MMENPCKEIAALEMWGTICRDIRDFSWNKTSNIIIMKNTELNTVEFRRSIPRNIIVRGDTFTVEFNYCQISEECIYYKPNTAKLMPKQARHILLVIIR